MENLYWDEYEAFGTEDMATLLCDYETFSARIVTGRNKVRHELPAINTVDVLCEGRWVRVDHDRYSVNGEPVAVPAAPLLPRESCVQHLIDCIVQDSEPVTGVHTGLAVAEIVTAAYQSARSGRFVDLPLTDENHPLLGPDEQIVDGLLD
jgi:predicted dehydrogenase